MGQRSQRKGQFDLRWSKRHALRVLSHPDLINVTRQSAGSIPFTAETSRSARRIRAAVRAGNYGDSAGL
jgi:hypothetical protein